MQKQKNTNKTNRGWVVDQLLIIGHLEATLSHLDEYVIARNEYADLGEEVYEARKTVMEDLLKEAKDPGLWCVIKHLATAYVMAEEVCHAREFDSETEILMTGIGDSLAGAAELALGLEKTACLRCLSERSAKDENNEG